jgi:hypothetical protein
MRIRHSAFRTNFIATAARLLVLALIFPVAPWLAFGQEPAITFTATVPTPPAQVQLYRLAPTPVPTAFINEKLMISKLPALKLEQRTLVSRGTSGLTDIDKVRVYADPVSGDVHFVPNLLQLATTGKSLALDAPTAIRIARTALADVRFIPKDVTTLKLSDAIPVMGGSTNHGATTEGVVAPVTEPKLVMTVVPAVRYASGLRIYGRGSRVVISIANDQSITGALRRWRTASMGTRIKPVLNATQVKADIIRQLTPFAKNGATAAVTKIELAYYDGNANYIQPVYRFEAALTSPNKEVSSAMIAGFVPVGTALEPIPDLANEPAGAKPGASTSPNESILQREIPERRMEEIPALKSTEMAGGIGTPAVISVGEFVNQDWPNNGAYIDMANNFLSGLNAGHASAPAGDPPFSRTIWWTAYSWQVNSPQSKNWMNAVNVAYTVPHGDWLLNTTLSNYGDPWYVNKIGTGGNPGFGAAAGGKLATWVILSCEVIPSVYDRANEIGGNGNGASAFDAWFPVFQGLHNAIGFRTIMFYPDDALNYGFGQDAGRGGDINAAWFHEVAANDGNDGTYVSQHLKGNVTVHYDRASTMIDARNLGQSIYNVGAQSASTTLWNFWMGN